MHASCPGKVCSELLLLADFLFDGMIWNYVIIKTTSKNVKVTINVRQEGRSKQSKSRQERRLITGTSDFVKRKIRRPLILFLIKKPSFFNALRGNLTGRKKRVENWTVHLRVCVVFPPFF
jgi:hypothetical protein